jgi:hypothetical protein
MQHGEARADRTKPGLSISTLEVAVYMPCFETKLPNLKLKTQSKQGLGSLPKCGNITISI